MSNLRSAAPFRPGRSPPSFAARIDPHRAGLRSPGEPATALDDRKFDPELSQTVAQTDLVALPLVASGPTVSYTPQPRVVLRRVHP